MINSKSKILSSPSGSTVVSLRDEIVDSLKRGSVVSNMGLFMTSIIEGTEADILIVIRKRFLIVVIKMTSGISEIMSYVLIVILTCDINGMMAHVLTFIMTNVVGYVVDIIALRLMVCMTNKIVSFFTCFIRNHRLADLITTYIFFCFVCADTTVKVAFLDYLRLVIIGIVPSD